MKKIKNQIESFGRLERLIIEEIDNQREKVSKFAYLGNECFKIKVYTEIEK